MIAGGSIIYDSSIWKQTLLCTLASFHQPGETVPRKKGIVKIVFVTQRLMWEFFLVEPTNGVRCASSCRLPSFCLSLKLQRLAGQKAS